MDRLAEHEVVVLGQDSRLLSAPVSDDEAYPVESRLLDRNRTGQARKQGRIGHGGVGAVEGHLEVGDRCTGSGIDLADPHIDPGTRGVEPQEVASLHDRGGRSTQREDSRSVAGAAGVGTDDRESPVQ